MKADNVTQLTAPAERVGIDRSVAVPLLLVHVLGLALAPFTFSNTGLAACIGLYVLTGLGVTAGAHRLFAHRSYRPAPVVRDLLALCFLLSAQGSLRRWIRDHLIHHHYSDRSGDPHSPKQKGFLHAHFSWLWKQPPTPGETRALYARYTRGLDPGRVGRFFQRGTRLAALHLALIIVAYIAGAFIEAGCSPAALLSGYRTGLSVVIWGVPLRIVLVMHSTFLVNSAAHLFGKRPYAASTADDARNLWWLSILALGEGWHNNHHHRPAAANHGFHKWWEIDLSFIVLSALGSLGLLHDLKVFRASKDQIELWWPSTTTEGHDSLVQAGKPWHARVFDALAIWLYALLAKARGYSFRVGTEPELMRDGRAILRAVWGPKGGLPPSEISHFGERYDRATSWIVAYHHGQPAACMGLLDMRVASIALDYGQRLAPASLHPTTTRELGRLAILPEFRSGANLVMIGLLREMFILCRANQITHLLSCCRPEMYRFYRRFNKTARLIDPPADPVRDPVKEAYFANLRAAEGPNVLMTFEIAGASPYLVFSRLLRSLFRSVGLSSRGRARS